MTKPTINPQHFEGRQHFGLKAHGTANIRRGRDVAHAKKPALPAIGTALGVSGLCRGGFGFRHQRSGSGCKDLMGVAQGKG